MTPRQLRRETAKTQVRARIVSDGCRDYLVEVVSANGSRLLRHRRGSILKFRSLAEAHRVLRRCGVGETVMRQRVADDETCASFGAPTAAALSAPAFSAPAFSAPALSAPALSAPALSAPAFSAPALIPGFHDLPLAIGR